jgi:hypothetical protein
MFDLLLKKWIPSPLTRCPCYHHDREKQSKDSSIPKDSAWVEAKGAVAGKGLRFNNLI